MTMGFIHLFNSLNTCHVVFYLYVFFTLSCRELYGEDIADTYIERSDSVNEDEYEESFMDDDDPEISPPSPISCGGGTAITHLIWTFGFHFI